MYRDIIKNTSVGEDDFEFERMTNLAAVVVHLNAQGDTSQAIPESSGLVTRLGQANSSSITNPQNLPISYMNQLDTKKSNIKASNHSHIGLKGLLL